MGTLAVIAAILNPAPKALTKIEVRHFWQMAFYASHGFHVKYSPRGNRVFMVRRAG